VDNEQLLTVAEAADALGVSASTVRRWCGAGLLTVVKVAGRRRWYVPATTIRRLLELPDAARGWAA